MIKLITKHIKDSIGAVWLYKKQLSDIEKLIIECRKELEKESIETEFFKQRFYKTK